MTQPLMAIKRLAGNWVSVSWAGGFGPFQLQMTASLSVVDWKPVGLPTLARSAIVPTNGTGFLRVQDLIPVVNGTTEPTSLEWLLPTLEPLLEL